MQFANRSHQPQLYQAADHASRKIGAIRIVAEILGEPFFAAVRSLEAGLNGHLTHGVPQSCTSTPFNGMRGTTRNDLFELSAVTQVISYCDRLP